jgi:hypothetical protein
MSRGSIPSVGTSPRRSPRVAGLLAGQHHAVHEAADRWGSAADHGVLAVDHAGTGPNDPERLGHVGIPHRATVACGGFNSCCQPH